VPSRGIDAAKSQKLKAKHQTPNAHNTEHRTPASYRTPNACIIPNTERLHHAMPNIPCCLDAQYFSF